MFRRGSGAFSVNDSKRERESARAMEGEKRDIGGLVILMKNVTLHTGSGCVNAKKTSLSPSRRVTRAPVR